jgi:hypothetical protein
MSEANLLPGPPGAANIGDPPLLKEKKMRKLFGPENPPYDKTVRDKPSEEIA